MRKVTIKKVVKRAPVLTDHDYNLWVLMRQTREAMHRAREKELQEFGVSNIMTAALLTVKAIGPEATPADIARRLVREPHSVSGLLLRMEKHGLIKRVKDLPRKNMIRIVLTKKGEDIYKASTKRVTTHEILSVLSEKEKKTLWGYLQKLREKALKLSGIERDLPFPPRWG